MMPGRYLSYLMDRGCFWSFYGGVIVAIGIIGRNELREKDVQSTDLAAYIRCRNNLGASCNIV